MPQLYMYFCVHNTFFMNHALKCKYQPGRLHAIALRFHQRTNHVRMRTETVAAGGTVIRSGWALHIVELHLAPYLHCDTLQARPFLDIRHLVVLRRTDLECEAFSCVVMEQKNARVCVCVCVWGGGG
jgi:hypothetical protein